jgi:hypothetical protein
MQRVRASLFALNSASLIQSEFSPGLGRVCKVVKPIRHYPRLTSLMPSYIGAQTTGQPLMHGWSMQWVQSGGSCGLTYFDIASSTNALFWN